jgi:hypothetical protein
MIEVFASSRKEHPEKEIWLECQRSAQLVMRLRLAPDDVGSRRVYLVETPTKFDQAVENPQTSDYVGDAGQ